jgi:diguanylate cyclase (GGDEF)-like protein
VDERELFDVLTGLPNRHAFDLALDSALASCSAGDDAIALILADLNGLKRINNAFGFPAADEVLRNVGEFLSKLARLGRTEAVVYRFGGDEFIALCPATTAPQAERLAVCIETEVSSLIVNWQGQEIGPLSISTGLAYCPQDGRHADDLLRAADNALFRKKRGDNGEPPAPRAVAE